MRQLIDKQEILDFPREEYSGFFNFVNDLIQKNNLGTQEDDAYQLCEDVLEGIMNVVESAEVVEERKITNCILHESEYDVYFPIYHYTCGECGESIDSVISDEKYKFCPYCGAQYEKIEFC